MDIFSFFTFAGGLGLFLFGMNVLGEAIARQAGGRLKTALERIASNRVVGVLVGAGVTAVIQSSGATTVMILGFINSGIMTLQDSISLIFGANIGTTATAWLLALTDVSGESTLLRLLSPDSFVPVLAFVGAVLLVFTKRDVLKDAGMMLLGFSVLMFGMSAMSSAMAPLRESAAFRQALTLLNQPLLGVLAGFIMAAVLQSSSASVGIVQAAASSGAITIASALPLIMGVNIGAGLIVLFAGGRTNRDAKRASWVYMIHNILAALVFIIPLMLVEGLGNPDFLYTSINAFDIALLHTCYKTLNTAIQLPFIPQILWLTAKIVPPNPAEEKFALLDENFLKTPPVAVARCNEMAGEMARITDETVKKAARVIRNFDADTVREVRELESQVDTYEDKLGGYLVKLAGSKLAAGDTMEVSKILHGISDLERVSDHARNIVEAGTELEEKGIHFSPAASAELDVMMRAVEEVTSLTVEAFAKENRDAAKRVESLEQVVDDLRGMLRDRHIDRLSQGICSTTLGFVFTDILTDLERISDHCTNIATSVLQMRHAEYEPHRYQARIKAESASFNRLYDEYALKYRLSE